MGSVSACRGCLASSSCAATYSAVAEALFTTLLSSTSYMLPSMMRRHAKLKTQLTIDTSIGINHIRTRVQYTVHAHICAPVQTYETKLAQFLGVHPSTFRAVVGQKENGFVVLLQVRNRLRNPIYQQTALHNHAVQVEHKVVELILDVGNVRNVRCGRCGSRRKRRHSLL